jgi:hypothetical protein
MSTPNYLDLFRELLQEATSGCGPEIDSADLEVLVRCALGQSAPVGVLSARALMDLVLNTSRVDPAGELVLGGVLAAWVRIDPAAWETLINMASDPERSPSCRSRSWNAVAGAADSGYRRDALRAQAVRMLSYPPDNISLLVSMMEAAGSSFGGFLDPQAREAALKLGKHGDARVRRAACWLIYLAASAEHVRPLLRDVSESVRLKAVQTISRQRFHQRLLEAEAVSQKRLAQFAEHQELLGEAEGVLMGLAESPSREVRREAADILATGFASSPAAAAKLAELSAGDPSISVRIAAAAKLAALPASS